MMTDKLAKQRDERQQGLQAIFSTAPAEPPKPSTARRRSASKRSTWKMRAWYVRPETASRLRAYVNRQQETGSSIDASDVVDQAIGAWLDQQGT